MPRFSINDNLTALQQTDYKNQLIAAGVSTATASLLAGEDLGSTPPVRTLLKRRVKFWRAKTKGARPPLDGSTPRVTVQQIKNNIDNIAALFLCNNNVEDRLTPLDRDESPLDAEAIAFLHTNGNYFVYDLSTDIDTKRAELRAAKKLLDRHLRSVNV